MNRTIRVLHLEDMERDAELIGHMLGQAQVFCNTVWVKDKAEFETMASQSHFDLILCDYNLPGYNGLSALKFLRDRGIESPVIIISGKLGEEEAIECLKSGATDYLLKQRLERLPSAVIHALQVADEQLQRKRAEVALRENERFVRAMLDALPSAVAVLDETGKVMADNREWRERSQSQQSPWLCIGPGEDYLVAAEKAVAHGDTGAFKMARAIRDIFACRTASFSAEIHLDSSRGSGRFYSRLTRFPADGPVRVLVAHTDISAIEQGRT